MSRPLYLEAIEWLAQSLMREGIMKSLMRHAGELAARNLADAYRPEGVP